MENKNIYTKLLAVQKELTPIAKDALNPHFKSKYATLPAILAAIKPICTKHGLIVTQPIMNDRVYTIIADSQSGETLESNIILPANLNAQQSGSAITYFRRYTLASLLSLEIEDDDGNDASKPTPQPQQQPKQDDGKPWLTDKQFKDALDRIKGGEKDLFDKLTIAFRMKKEYKQQLEEAANTF